VHGVCEFNLNLSGCFRIREQLVSSKFGSIGDSEHFELGVRSSFSPQLSTRAAWHSHTTSMWIVRVKFSFNEMCGTQVSS
jgi:hypothetical protein